MGAIVFPWTSAAWPRRCSSGTWKALRAAATPSSCPAIRRATTAAGSARSSSRPPIWCATPSRDDKLRVISCEVQNARKAKDVRRAFCDMAARMGVAPGRPRAFKAAWDAQRAHDEALATAQERTLRRLVDERRAADAAAAAGDDAVARPLGILVVAHPYISHDPYLSGAVIDSLEEMGATVVYADAMDHERAYKKSFEFSGTMPWLINRELIGSILLAQDDIDGIVLISAFPCGPDSMTDDAIMRCIQGTPILNLMIDAQSGTAGVGDSRRELRRHPALPAEGRLCP